MTQAIDQAHAQAAVRVTLVGSVIDLVLGVLKIFVGTLTNSFALVSDGIHSLSDLVTDAFVLVITRLSLAKPDREHPYGHRRFETVGTIALGMVLFGVAGIIVYDSIRRISEPGTPPVPGVAGVLVAALSIASKEWIYRYTKRVADETASSLLLANAWHSRTDALSSIAVLLGILGAIAGYPVMDLLAAIFVGLMIGKIAWDLVTSSLSELVDTALPEEKVAAIRAHVGGMEGIRDAHELRTRRHGGQIFVDLHVQVGDHISVSEGHHLADHMSASLKKQFPEVSDVVVHIDPELDLEQAPNLDLPLRAEVRETLLSRWQGVLDSDALRRMELHYLENQVEADIYLDISILNNDLKGKLDKLVKDLPWLCKVNFYGTL